MPNLIVEKGKLNGKYKPVWESAKDTRSHKYAALRAYGKTKLEPGEKKRLKHGDKTIEQRSCYWT